MKDLDGVLGSWLLSAPALAMAVLCRMNQWVEDLLFLCEHVCHLSLRQINKTFKSKIK